MSLDFDAWLEGKTGLKASKMLHQDAIDQFTKAVQNIFFPEFGEEVEDISIFLEQVKENLSILLQDIERISGKRFQIEELACQFIEKLPKIEEILLTDLEALYIGDPAAYSKEEIILCYPGFYAIFIYRIAHALCQLDIPILPRILSERAHSKTGIDIHPKADIGNYFFIDHGTGIVIGETTQIGNRVKIYQGVTLGALSLRDGHKLAGLKRHPTILDDVTIYSEASIFGGTTIIGPNVTIQSNAFITQSVRKEDSKGV